MTCTCACASQDIPATLAFGSKTVSQDLPAGSDLVAILTLHAQHDASDSSGGGGAKKQQKK